MTEETLSRFAFILQRSPNQETFDRLLVEYGFGEQAVLERAIDRMGWPEIRAFQDELRRGQDVFEDAGGYLMRAIRRLFGLPHPGNEVTTYQDAARALVRRAVRARPSAASRQALLDGAEHNGMPETNR